MAQPGSGLPRDSALHMSPLLGNGRLTFPPVGTTAAGLRATAVPDSHSPLCLQSLCPLSPRPERDTFWKLRKSKLKSGPHILAAAAAFLVPDRQGRRVNGAGEAEGRGGGVGLQRQGTHRGAGKVKEATLWASSRKRGAMLSE